MNKEELYKKYKNLIYKVIKDMNCIWRTEDEWQEYYDWGELGLLTAINTYNPSMESKTSYFYICIKNSIRNLFILKTHYIRSLNYTKMIPLGTDNEQGIKIDETIPDEKINIEKEVILKDSIDRLYKALNKMTPKRKELLCRWYGIGRKQESLVKMTKEYGVTKQALSMRMKTAIKELKRIYLEGE